MSTGCDWFSASTVSQMKPAAAPQTWEVAVPDCRFVIITRRSTLHCERVVTDVVRLAADRTSSKSF
jgi:hypothetical protein